MVSQLFYKTRGFFRPFLVWWMKYFVSEASMKFTYFFTLSIRLPFRATLKRSIRLDSHLRWLHHDLLGRPCHGVENHSVVSSWSDVSSPKACQYWSCGTRIMRIFFPWSLADFLGLFWWIFDQRITGFGLGNQISVYWIKSELSKPHNQTI